MVETRNSDARSGGWEKAAGDLDKKTEMLSNMINEINIQMQQTEERNEEPFSALGSQLTGFMEEVRAVLTANKSLDNDGSTSKGPHHTPPPSGSTVIPQMTMPTFDGTEAIAWLARAEQYFLRFGDNGTLDEYEAFAAIRHEGTLADYVAAFEARLAQISDLADHQYLGFFLANLRPEIRLHMKAAHIANYSDAVQLALRIDHHVEPPPPGFSSAPPSRSDHHAASRPFSKGPATPQSSFSASSTPRPQSRRFKNMTSEEYKKHIAAGTCFRCGLKFSPTHRCPPKTLNVIFTDDDDCVPADPASDVLEEPETDTEFRLSELSSHGLDSYRTLKLYGSLHSHQVTVMVDSGASHCFISDRLAHSLDLFITATTPFSVRLGDGSLVRTAGFCQDIPLVLADNTFPIACYVFPLRGIDIILGISWLATLGDVIANWRQLTMQFSVNGKGVLLRGVPMLIRRACSSSDLQLLEEEDTCWLLCHPFSTPAQQNWAAKLLGYDFTIAYKEGRLNQAADALSRRDTEAVEFSAISRPVWPEWKTLKAQIAADPQLSAIRSALDQGDSTAPHYTNFISHPPGVTQEHTAHTAVSLQVSFGPG
ncbi:hypothetical protein C2S52_021093 [Perilla frutescens var. hirtella]|nr:hypothetical protein C2S52_021093 [Perilla frutescens var. hirtella]